MARDIPRVPGLDHSMRFLADPYRFIGLECDALGSDAIRVRMMLQPMLCLRGPEAASLFYDKRRFLRAGAAPEAVRATLFGKGGVQTLDGAAHLARKEFFLTVCGRAATHALAAIAADEWRSCAVQWTLQERLVLYPAAQDWLARTAFRWAGLDVGPGEMPERIGDVVALFDAAASGVRAHLHARSARHRLEGWLAHRIARHRSGAEPFPAGSPAALAAAVDNNDGRLLPPRIAAVELLNLVRPITAVSVFVTFAAHALHVNRPWRERLAQGSEAELDNFVQEVRRFYPFFPAVAARVCEAFTWHGLHFPAGTRTLLDLHGTNHDPRAWVEPETFRPERFGAGAPGLYTFVPQGGARAEDHHRCPGEGFTVALMKLAVRLLVGGARYQ
ncbi:MAG: cytochrome P450, partial [Ramlibacter sp.]